ncbi:MAG: carboxypeptidase-like regulatory domain-containing protein [Flavobacterium sp.]|nr:carboxypeptidase-like regulatory domain-containing protein [Flavobacterium sp.]
MKYFTSLLFLFFTANLVAQETQLPTKVAAVIINANTLLPLSNVNIINVNRVKGTISNSKGSFEIEASPTDTLHITMIGFESIKVKVTNDWLKNGNAKIKLTEKAIALDEVIIKKYNLTGYLEVDTKLIPEIENYRYSISGLSQGYEGGEYSPNAFSRVMNSIFNPADMLYNFFGKKPKELKRLKEMKKDDTVKHLLETKFDRETISVLLGIDKKEISEILQHCNYSQAFIETANDLQILDAISQCYEEYKVLKKK